MTRYTGAYDPSAPPQGFSIPDEYLVQKDGWREWRMTAYRAKFNNESGYVRAVELFKAAGCFPDVRGWLDRNIIDDMGSNRYIRSDAPPEKKESRAQHNVAFLDSLLRLMLDSLEKDEQGRWGLGKADDPKDNPSLNPFVVMHHLFCNAVDPPLRILVQSPHAAYEVPVKF